MIVLDELHMSKVDNGWILSWTEWVEIESGKTKHTHNEVFTYESALGLRIFEILGINKQSPTHVGAN